MECMKSFSTFSRIRFDNGLRCAEGELAILPDLRGKGSRKRVANKVPGPKWKQSWQIPNSCFSAVEFFTAFFAAFFVALFAALFAALFRCTFRHIFRHARPCKLSRQGISIHVTTKRLCRMRWHSIDKHTACHIHCAWQPSWNRRLTLNALHPTKSSSKSHNQKKY